MAAAETRKVQITGAKEGKLGTFIVSLPKQWAKLAGLKGGSEVQLVPQDRHSLLIYTAESPEAAVLMEADVDVNPKAPIEDTVRNFITQYLAGSDIIHMDLRQISASKRVQLKEAIRRLLIGAEIISETTDEITVQCFLSQTNLPLLSALDRMEALVGSMQQDAVNALLENDQRLAEDVVQRDVEVDRFYFYIVRQLTAASIRSDRIRKIGLASPRAALGYRQVVKSIERAGDHARRIADIATRIELQAKSSLANSIQKMHQMTDAIFQDALRSLRSVDVRLAHDTIRRIDEVIRLEEKGIRQLLSGKFSVESVLELRLALESLRRIAEYGADIAENSINLSVER